MKIINQINIVQKHSFIRNFVYNLSAMNFPLFTWSASTLVRPTNKIHN